MIIRKLLSRARVSRSSSRQQHVRTCFLLAHFFEVFFLVLSLFTFSLVALALFSPGPVMGDSVADSVAGKVPKRTALGGAGNLPKQLLQVEVADPKCVNCGEKHRGTTKNQARRVHGDPEEGFHQKSAYASSTSTHTPALNKRNFSAITPPR